MSWKWNPLKVLSLKMFDKPKWNVIVEKSWYPYEMTHWYYMLLRHNSNLTLCVCVFCLRDGPRCVTWKSIIFKPVIPEQTKLKWCLWPPLINQEKYIGIHLLNCIMCCAFGSGIGEKGGIIWLECLATGHVEGKEDSQHGRPHQPALHDGAQAQEQCACVQGQHETRRHVLQEQIK